MVECPENKRQRKAMPKRTNKTSKEMHSHSYSRRDLSQIYKQGLAGHDGRTKALSGWKIIALEEISPSKSRKRNKKNQKCRNQKRKIFE